VSVAADRLEQQVKERTAELAQSVEELRALGDVSQAVNSTIDLETVRSTIGAKAVQLLGSVEPGDGRPRRRQ
jgi:nitrate/nitrite-specific signal transduction histidine kinase